MSRVLTQYRALEEAALESPPETFASDREYGPHCRLVSAFTWHPLVNLEMRRPHNALGGALLAVLLMWRAAYEIPQPWGDESFTWRLASADWSTFFEMLGNDLHPPLYFALVKLLPSAGLGAFDMTRTIGFVLAAALLAAAPMLLLHWPRPRRELLGMIGMLLCILPFGLYLLMLRYYGLLAVCITYALLCLGNSFIAEDPQRARHWILGSALAFALAALTNYQTYLVWPIAIAIAAWLHKREGRRWEWMALVHGLALLTALALTITLFVVFTGEAPWGQLADAATSPFVSGIGSLADVVARIGLVVLTFFHSEFVPLWWPPLFLCFAIAIYRLSPRVHQLPLSPAARLYLLTAGASALVLVLLTTTVIPVGVEFLPARLCYLFPLFALGGVEWLLKRFAHLRWIGLLALVNLGIGLWSMDRVNIAMHEPAPTVSAPFLHATYITPTPAVRTILSHAPLEDRLLIVDDPTAEIAIQERLRMSYQTTYLMLTDLPAEVLYPGERFYVFESTRERSHYYVYPELEGWEAYLADHATLLERWEFLPEDPLWLALKRAGLRRPVAPYKRQLSLYRVDSNAPILH